MAKKEYSNGEVTVLWQPGLCIHSARCVQSLGEVFDPNRKPWVDMSKASSDEIVAAVGNCPSGALSMKDSGSANTSEQTVKIQLVEGGPLILKGVCDLTDENGRQQKQKNVAFCRCTRSGSFPYCDGSHKQ